MRCSAVLLAALLCVNCRGKPPESADVGTSGSPKEAATDMIQSYVPTPIEPVPVEQLTRPVREEVGSPDEVGIIITDYGRIVVEFFPDLAPLHVANFKKLARAGFYDGTTFHRVVPGFVIQGGDPNSKDDDPRNDGLGGPPWTINAEFSDRPHVKGTLSMARSSDPNSAGSQFFIVLERARHLDGQYSIFGRVIHGQEVVDDIGREKRDPREDADKPAVKIRQVRILKRAELGL